MTRRLVKDTVIYGAGAFLTKALGFLLIPLYTRYLDTTDYGTLALLNLLLQVLSFVCLLGVSTAAMRFYLDASATPESQREVYGNATLLLVACPVAVLAVLALPLYGLVDRFVPALQFFPYVVAVMLTALCTPIAKLLLGLFRVERRPVAFIAFQIGFFLFQAGAMIFALVGLGAGLAGQVYAQLLANFVFWCVALVALARYSRPRHTPALSAQLLGYGVPLIPFFILTWTNEAAGRFLLEHFGSLADVGLFTLASQFSGILGLVAMSVENALMPHFIRHAPTPEGMGSLGRLTVQHFALLGLVGLGINLVATPAILLMAAPGYHEAARYVAPLTLGAWLYLSCNPAIWTLNFAKRSAALSVFRAVSTGVLVLSLWAFLGPLRLGIPGVAYATILTGLFAAVSGFALALAAFQLRIDWGRVGLCTATVVAGGIGITWLDPGRLDPAAFALQCVVFAAAAAATLAVAGIGNPLRWLRSARGR